MSNQGLICSAERLTEETMVGPFAALKNKAAEKPGAFGSYDLYWAYLNAVTRLKFYEDSGLSPQQVLELAWSRRPEGGRR